VRPDIIKIDRDLTSGVHRDPAKSALIEAFVRFAHRTGAAVCAEGIEELDEAVFLAELDVLYGQGYALSRPADPWATISPAVSDELLNRSMSTEPELGGVLLPDTGDRRLELVIARLSTVRSVGELNTVAPLIAKELSADAALVSSWHPNGDYVRSLTGTDAGSRYWMADFPRTAHALRTHEAVQVVLGESDADEAEVALLRAQGFGSLLMVPVVHAGETIGLLEAMSAQSTPWSRTSINRARIIAYQLGAVLAALVGPASLGPSESWTVSDPSSSPVARA
jgi:GAF domain-containing protein